MNEKTSFFMSLPSMAAWGMGKIAPTSMRNGNDSSPQNEAKGPVARLPFSCERARHLGEEREYGRYGAETQRGWER